MKKFVVCVILLCALVTPATKANTFCSTLFTKIYGLDSKEKILEDFDFEKIKIYDRFEWLSLVNRLAIKSTDFRFFDEAFFSLSQSVPLPLKSEILSNIARHYEGLSKYHAGTAFTLLPPLSRTFMWLSTKRSIDLLVNFLTQPQAIIIDHLKRTGNVESALQAWYTRQNNVLFFNSRRGNYPASLVIDVIKKTNSIIADKKYKDAEIVIGGSFSAGKATLNSFDLDVSISPPNLKNLFHRFEAATVDILSSYGFYASKVKIDATPHANREIQMASINPIIFYIKNNQIFLKIYPPLVSTARTRKTIEVKKRGEVFKVLVN